MNPKLKLTAYGVLLILCAWFGCEFYANYSAVTKAAADNGASSPGSVTDASNNPVTNSSAPPATNGVAAAGSNAPSTPTEAASPAPAPPGGKTPSSDDSSKRSAMIAYLAALVGSIIGLGLLIASDVTSFMGTQAIDFLFNDAGEGQRDPEYERAEAVWANGKHLDAIQMMRDYVKKHPRELYVSLRIAEIYEKDLKNYLAAVLEYEEVLKHKFTSERWGWAAIHLCNLYSRLHKSDKAVALLRRIADDYPKTGAAKKARARLGIPEPEPAAAKEAAVAEAAPEAGGEQSVIVMEEHPPELEPRKESPAQPAKEPEPPAPPEPPKPSLPPGFRPKK